MRLEMRAVRHLDVWLGHPSEDHREVIIDSGGTPGIGHGTRYGDVRITDHKGVVKVRFDEKGLIRDVLVDDIFVWQREKK